MDFHINMMKKLYVLLACTLLFYTTCFAQEKAQIFPKEGLAHFLGLDDTSSPPFVKDFRAADIQNIMLDITGAAYKRNGYSLHCLLDTNHTDDDFEAVTSIYELYTSADKRYVLATCGSNIFVVSTAGVKTDITGSVTITEGQNYQFVWTSALDTAIGTNDEDVPIECTGAVTTALDVSDLTDTLTKAKSVIWWKNYLIFGNTVENATERSTRIRWSNVGTTETWSDDDYVDIATLGGQQIEALGILYDNLYIFLTDSIYKVSLVGGNELIVVTKVSEGIGCIAKGGVQNIQIGNSEGLIFLSRDKTINYLDGVKVQEISTLISEEMDDLNASRLLYAVSLDDQSNSHYYLACTTGTATNNNLLLDFHYGIGEWSEHIQIDANALGVANDANTIPQIYFGNHKSFMYQMQDEDLDSDIDGITGSFTKFPSGIVVCGQDIADSETASGLIVLYDTSADFSNVTGATVRITSGTGSGTEYIIAQPFWGDHTSASGIIVVESTVTATGNSVYSIGDIDAYYTTKWYDMGVAPQRKNFGELFLWTTTTTNSDIPVTYATDFSDTLTTSTVDLQADGSLWGTAIWGTDTWGGTSSSLSRIPLNVSGRYIKASFREADIDEPMTLWGYSFVFWPLSIF